MADITVISVKNVSKSFRVYQDKGHMLKEMVLHWNRNKYEKVKVIDNISFEVKKGEAIGLIGSNGCGKSTTLKLLTRIIYPDKGEIKIRGRVSSLLELGAGFHPDLSGRENIYINASIFGLSRKEIDNKLDDIIEFSELREFIDNPVRTYSSGMYMKLAFSVAINVNADILIIDEILAVGDVNFQAKCFNKMQEIKNNGTTLLLVSHSMDQIERICDKCIWLHNGKIRASGVAEEVDFQYLTYMNEMRKKSVEIELKQIEEKNNNEKKWEKRFGSGEAEISEVKCIDEDGNPVNTLKFGKSFSVAFTVMPKQSMDEIWFGVSLIRNDGVVCYGTNTVADDNLKFHISDNKQVELKFEKPNIMPGIFYIDVCIGKKSNEFVDYWQSAKTIEIFDTRKDIGIVKMPHKWNIESK